MRYNRELLASINFEPCDATIDSRVDSFETQSNIIDFRESQEPNASISSNTGQEKEDGQNEATKLVIRCFKRALTQSITSISCPEKQRPLNPHHDFSIHTTTEFFCERVGFSCCGKGATSVKPRRATCMPLSNRKVSDVKKTESGNGFFRTTIHHSSVLEDDLLEELDIPWIEPGDNRNNWWQKTDGMDTSDDDDDDIPPADFTFTDYSPMCYCHIREFFKVNPKEYCDVLRDCRWHSIPSPGKSAAKLFFCGRNWVIKTMTNMESQFLRHILHRYYYHVRDNPYTLLPHFVGHYRLEVNGEAFNFIIMQNVFATTNTIHEKYDLKGSTIGRYASAAEKMRATCTQKDLDINNPIHIGNERRQLLIGQLKKDSDFLKRSGIMDYSFLVGIHILPAKGRVVGSAFYNTSNTDQNASFSFPAHTLGGGSIHNSIMDPIQGHNVIDSAFQEKNGVLLDGRCFNSDEDGMLSNDVPGLRREIYYIGIIDILQKYNFRKHLETFLLFITSDYKRISCRHPNAYASRFISFISSIIV